MTFLDTLLSLDKAATPGPFSEPHLTDHRAGACRCGYIFAWEAGEYCVATIHKASDNHNNEYPPDEQAAATGGLLVLLRNAAPALAAVIEAAEMMPVGAAMEDEPGPYVLVPKDDLRALRDALFALDKGAK